MRQVAVVMSTVAVLMWATGVASAQNRRPDFSGTWTLDVEKTTDEGGIGAGGGRGDRGGGLITIRQTDQLITITRRGLGDVGGQPTAYRLDGSNVEIGSGRGGRATASWEGRARRSRIVITETGVGRGGGGETTTYSMDGDWMVVETERPGRRGGDRATTKRYYKKD